MVSKDAAPEGRAEDVPQVRGEVADQLNVMDRFADRVRETIRRQVEAVGNSDYAADAKALRDEAEVWREAFDGLTVDTHPLVWHAIDRARNGTARAAVEAEQRAARLAGVRRERA